MECISKEVVRGATSALDDSGLQNRTSKELPGPYILIPPGGPHIDDDGNAKDGFWSLVSEVKLLGSLVSSSVPPLLIGRRPAPGLSFATLPGRFGKCQVVSI